MNSYLFLILAVAAVASTWLNMQWRLQGAAVMVGALTSIGLLSGVLEPVSIVWLMALFATAYWAERGHSGRAVGWAMFTVLALGIGFGLLPGFSPVVFTEAVSLKPDSVPYSLQFGLGKPLVAVALLLWLVPVVGSRQELISSLRAALPVIAVTVVAVPLLAWGMGYVHPALALPPLQITLTWMVINLFLVCTVEEGFFRGLVQRGLAQVVPPWLAITIAAMLFGLAHFGGGWTYIMLASVAGVGYGLAYQRSGQRIEAAILAHFGVNLTHFMLFTYPAG